ncbi:nitrogen permease regulator of amino acid transport activity 3-domain-containing protein [Daedaleopsis nitida]|nr:nitrogen permease regulator of amino acid transport activity 3-domain-containing protein [Daedaleopsis nitida]
MSETLICVLLVTSSAKGSNLVYHWPPSPQTTPRLARPLPTNDFPGSFSDNPWRAANSTDHITEEKWHPSTLAPEDLSEYYWQRSSVRRPRAVSFSRQPPSHPTSRRASPSKDGSGRNDDASPFGLGCGRCGSGACAGCVQTGDEYDTLLGYSTEFLAQILCPQSSMCHQKFELVVDDLAFIGHPKGQSPQVEERNLTPERMERGEQNSGRTLHVQTTTGTGDSGIKTFHFVLVLDLPDPSSSASGNIARYFDTMYQQIAFNVTAVLYQEQVLHQYVETECERLSLLRDEYANRGESFADFMYEATKVSSIAPAMQTLYESIKKQDVARITLHDLPLELQLPPHLDSLLHAEEDVEPEEEVNGEDGEPNAWGPEMSFAWRLPALTPWKALLRLDDEDEQGYELYMQLRTAQLHPEERDLAEQLLRFIDLATVNLSLADMASLLDWNLESQVYPAVRWLVLHRKAKVVDVVHQGLKTVFSIPQKFPEPLAALSEQFAATFAQAGVPPLPKLLVTISTATHTQPANHFYATVVRSKELIPLYFDVVLWMLKHDLLIRLHLRIRIIATPELKKRVRKRWEEHVMRKRSRSRARSISRSRERANGGSERGRGRGRGRGNADDEDEKGGPVLEPVSESRSVDYWVSLSPKTAREHTRRRDSEEAGDKADSDEEAQDRDRRERDREKTDEYDEEFLSSSADEGKWDEYYQSGGNDNIASMIRDPARATPLERRWLAGMSEGKDPHIVRRFERIHQYFDGKCSDDEILYRAEISRKILREVIHHYEEYLQTFLHPS